MTVLLSMLGAVIVLAAGYAVGGQTGLLAVAALAAVGALLAARLRIPPAPRRARAARPARDPNAVFGDYRRIESALGQARLSRRNFDYAARPLLQRLLTTLLAGRHHADPAADPKLAREAIGEDLWPLVDPARPPSDSTSEPGITPDELAQLIGRLEDL